MIYCSVSQILMPGICLCVLTAITGGSIAKVNSRGDSGQPCLVDHKDPLLLMHYPALTFHLRIESEIAVGQEMPLVVV